MPTDLVLHGATTTSGARVDVVLRDGLVAAVTEAGADAPASAGPTAGVLDLDGYLLLPALAEPHAHLDKALTWATLAPGYVDLPAALAVWGEASGRLDIAETRD